MKPNKLNLNLKPYITFYTSSICNTQIHIHVPPENGNLNITFHTSSVCNTQKHIQVVPEKRKTYITF